MIRLFAFFILVIFVFEKTRCQDPVFSQFSINSLHLNPAVAGSANAPRFFLHYRNQWPQMNNAFITYQGSYDQFVNALNGGVGINVVRDNIANGIISSTNLDLIYSYRFKVSKKLTFQAGLQASFIFRSTNTASLQTLDNINIVPASHSTTQPDFGVGFLGMTPKTQIGISFSHLNDDYLRFNSYFVKSPLKINLFYSRKFKILYNQDDVKERGFFVTPSILVQKQSSSIMLNYGLGFEVEKVLAGIWMRTNMPVQFSAAIFSLGYAFDFITVGYSYDYNMLSLNRLMPTTGAHEITFMATFPLDPKRGRYGPIKSPFPLAPYQ